MNKDDQLTPHFKLSEFFVHNSKFDDESWDWLAKQNQIFKKTTFGNLQKLAERLEKVREQAREPVHINSGFRCPSVNKAVGGEDNSYHMKGMAADIMILGIPARTVQQKLSGWSGGLGKYPAFTDLEIRPYKARW